MSDIKLNGVALRVGMWLTAIRLASHERGHARVEGMSDEIRAAWLKWHKGNDVLIDYRGLENAWRPSTPIELSAAGIADEQRLVEQREPETKRLEGGHVLRAGDITTIGSKNNLFQWQVINGELEWRVVVGEAGRELHGTETSKKASSIERLATAEEIAPTNFPLNRIADAQLREEVKRIRHPVETLPDENFPEPKKLIERPEEIFEVTIAPSGSSYAFDDVLHAMIRMRHPNFIVRHVAKVRPLPATITLNGETYRREGGK